MARSTVSLLLWTVLLLSLSVAPMRAGTVVFLDNFEAGLSLWTANRSGAIVVDPLNSSNHALIFNQKNGGGDLISATIPLAAALLLALRRRCLRRN